MPYDSLGLAARLFVALGYNPSVAYAVVHNSDRVREERSGQPDPNGHSATPGSNVTIE